jgi:hypothetical protein
VHLTLKPNERAIEARGVSPTRVNSDSTCELEMEVGQPPDNVLPKYNAVAPSPELAPRAVPAVTR